MMKKEDKEHDATLKNESDLENTLKMITETSEEFKDQDIKIPEAECKVFHHQNAIFRHYCSCTPEELKVPSGSVYFFCITCNEYFNATFADLVDDQKYQSPNVPGKNEVSDSILCCCGDCGYSSVDFRMFNEHQCEAILAHMKRCVVSVENLTSRDLNALDNVSKVQCPSCDYSFFDDISLAKHMRMHLNRRLQIVEYTTLSRAGKRAKMQIEKIVEETKVCDTSEELMESLLKPVTEIITNLDPQNQLDDLGLNVSIPYENQKLLADIAKKLLSGAFKGEYERQFESADSNSYPPNHIIRKLKNNACECNRENDPDIKECAKCLQSHLKEYLETLNETSDSGNEKESFGESSILKQSSSSPSASDYNSSRSILNSSASCVDIRENFASASSSNCDSISMDPLPALLVNSESAMDDATQPSNDLEADSLNSNDPPFEDGQTYTPESPPKTFEEAMKRVIDKKNISGKFDIDRVSVTIDCNFDPSKVYSVYVFRSTMKHVCALCMEEIPPADLLDHLFSLHDETNIFILVI